MSDPKELQSEHLVDVEDEHRLETRTTFTELPILPARDPILEGEEFSGTYEVLGRVGEGGMSVVYKARHRILNRIVAIKVLHVHLIRDSIQIKRFQQEAQALFSLEHPNVVSVREFGLTKAGIPYLIMDYLEGTPLSQIIGQTGPVPVPRALDIFQQACDALQQAHAKGIVHRDIKPSNIVICKGPQGEDLVKIVDFGIAKLTQEGDINPGLTQTGDVFGSPLYMSPEQCLGTQLDQRTDIYALGCVMYETLSGKPPLAGETVLATIHKHTTEMPEPLTVPNCDEKLRRRLDEIIFKTLEKQPEKRYQTMAQLRKVLAEIGESTAFRSSTGVYIKYTRWHSKIAKQIAKYPIKFAAITIAVVSVAFCVCDGIYEGLRLLEPLNQPPGNTLRTLRWHWRETKVVEEAFDLDDKMRKGAWLVEEYEERYGHNDDRTIEVAKKFAQFLMNHGRYDGALRYVLNVKLSTELTRGTGDVRTVIADLKLAECQEKLGNKAAAKKLYEDAYNIYKRLPTATHEPAAEAALKAAELEFMDGNADIAAGLAKEAALQEPQDDDMAFIAGLTGDCYFMSANADGVSPQVRRKYFSFAEDKYDVCGASWSGIETGTGTAHDTTPDRAMTVPNELSKRVYGTEELAYNLKLSRLRLAELYAAEGKWKESAECYKKVFQDLGEDSPIAKDKDVQHDYARVLWRNNQWLEALRIYYKG